MTTVTSVVAGELKGRVLRECETSHPLGAYAMENRVRYLFMGESGVHELSASLSDDDTLVSCAADWPVFAWDEREMRDERGIALAGYPADAPLVQGRGLSTIVVGPVHAGIIEPGRFTISSGGESIVHMEVQLGFARRGIEKRLEGRNAVEAAAPIARICGGCSVARSWTYARAIERLSGVTCHESVELARTVFAELERLYNHLFDLASASAGAGFGRGQMEGLRLKERVQRLCAMHGGHRFLFDTIFPGGVRSGTLDRAQVLRAELTELRGEVARYGASLFATDSVVSRFEGAGLVSHEIARAFGAVGPTLRASGGTSDMRVVAPYGVYAALQPSVAVAQQGDGLARARVKFSEALESLRLLDLSLEALGTGPVSGPVAFPPVSGHAVEVSEGPRGADVVCVDVQDGVLRRLHVISASFRNWPVVVRSVDGTIVPDFPLINKTFNLCYACADR